MKVFVLTVRREPACGRGTQALAFAGGRQPAIAFLEQRVGVELLLWTTRAINLSEVGERYVAICRRVLTELEEADGVAAAPRAAPCGLLTITAPVVSGEMVLRPILDAFFDAHPAVPAKFQRI